MSTRAQNLLKEALRCCRDAEVVEEQRVEIDLARPQEHTTQKGVGIRVNNLGHIGYAWSDTWKNELDILKQAINGAQTGPAGVFSEKVVAKLLPELAVVAPEESLRQLQTFVKWLDFQLPTLLRERSFNLQARMVRHAITLTTARGMRTWARTLHLFFLVSPQEPRISAVVCTTSPVSNPAQLISALAWRTVNSQEMGRPDTDTLPAVFGAEAAGAVLQDWASNVLCAPHEEWQEAQKIGLHAGLNIKHNALLPGALGSVPFDGEGTPSKVFPLVEDGRILQPLVDRLQASIRGFKCPTSSVRRWGKAPVGGYSNLVLEPGNSCLRKMCSEIDYGVFLDRLTPVPASFRQPGEFCRVAESAFLLQKGVPVCRLPRLLVKASYREILGEGLLGIGVEQELHGRALAVPICCSQVHLSQPEATLNTDNWMDVPGLWW